MNSSSDLFIHTVYINTNGLKYIAIPVPDAYPPALYFLRVVLEHSVDPMSTQEWSFCGIKEQIDPVWSYSNDILLSWNGKLYWFK